MAKLLQLGLAVLVASAMSTSSLIGQSRSTFVQLSSAVTWLEVADIFDAEPERHLAFAVGRRLGSEHQLELGVTAIDLQLTSREMIGYAYTQTELRATPVRLTYQYQPSGLRLGPVRPHASAGALWTRVTHRTENDVSADRQRTSVRGLEGALGLGVRIIPRAAVFGRGGYRYFEEFPSPISMTGPWADFGLRLFW